jgi:hypothetical protein
MQQVVYGLTASFALVRFGTPVFQRMLHCTIKAGARSPLENCSSLGSEIRYHSQTCTKPSLYSAIQHIPTITIDALNATLGKNRRRPWGFGNTLGNCLFRNFQNVLQAGVQTSQRNGQSPWNSRSVSFAISDRLN